MSDDLCSGILVHASYDGPHEGPMDREEFKGTYLAGLRQSTRDQILPQERDGIRPSGPLRGHPAQDEILSCASEDECGPPLDRRKVGEGKRDGNNRPWLHPDNLRRSVPRGTLTPRSTRR